MIHQSCMHRTSFKEIFAISAAYCWCHIKSLTTSSEYIAYIEATHINIILTNKGSCWKGPPNLVNVRILSGFSISMQISWAWAHVNLDEIRNHNLWIRFCWTTCFCQKLINWHNIKNSDIFQKIFNWQNTMT